MKTREIENIYITLSDGCRLAARIWLPENASDLPVPAILEYLPYRKRDGTAIRDQLTHPYLAAHGYACIRVDMRGSGESDGVLSDEYTKREQDDCLEVLDWIVKQAWCSGKIGMMGISWGGFNSLQVAARRHPNLHAVVSLCSTDNRYTDDIHYMGGCLLNDNFQWSAVMSAMMSRTPDKALRDDWRQVWQDRLKQQTLLSSTWLRHPTYDSYWKHGSICEDWSAITCPVYLVGGWADGYTNTIPRMLESLQCPRKGLIGPWAHKYPHFGKPGPQIGFLQEILRWWDQWLKGIDTGIMNEPMYRVWMQDSIQPAPYYETRPGRWVAEDTWPSKRIQMEKLHFNQNGTLTDNPATSEIRVQSVSPQSIGEAAGAWCGYGIGPEKPLDQRFDDLRSICFDSVPTTESVEMLGSTVIELDLAVDKPKAFIAVRMNEVFPDGTSARIAYGLLNLEHRNGNEKLTPIKPGERMHVKLELKNVAHSFAPGNRVRIAISTTYWPLVWPSPEAVNLTVYACNSHASFPIRPFRDEDKQLPAFQPPESAPPLQLKYYRDAVGKRSVERDLADNTVTYHVLEDYGDYEIEALKLRTDYVQRESYRICDTNPSLAEVNIDTTIAISRGDWKTRTTMSSKMTGDKYYFYLDARLHAYEDEQLVFTKEWKEKIPRSEQTCVPKPTLFNREQTTPPVRPTSTYGMGEAFWRSMP